MIQPRYWITEDEVKNIYTVVDSEVKPFQIWNESWRGSAAVFESDNKKEAINKAKLLENIHINKRLNEEQ